MTGQELKQIRKKKGLTTAQVAEALGVDQRTIQRHESGATPLRRAHLILYAGLYGITQNDIKEGVAA